MISQENLKLSGRLSIVVTDNAGNVKDTREVDNLVVTNGLTFIASRMGGVTKAVMSHMAVGTSSAIAAAGQTDVQALLGTKQLLSVAGGTPSTTSIAYACTFGAGVSTGGIQEAAIFNSGTAATGDMLCRTVFPIINKGALDTMTVNWTINLVAV